MCLVLAIPYQKTLIWKSGIAPGTKPDSMLKLTQYWERRHPELAKKVIGSLNRIYKISLMQKLWRWREYGLKIMPTNKNHGRMIVAIDESASCINALKWAKNNADDMGLSIHLINAWQYVYPAGDVLAGGPALVVSYSSFDAEENAQLLMKKVIEKCFGHEPPQNLTSETINGLASHILIEASRDAQLLVMGSRGRGAFVEFIMGSVSRACSARAHCPVVIVNEHSKV